ncbi:MAG: hypothetical protein LBD30_05515 [Verrucomicrobiales bacterium]|jgi:hypothetical protein|nr:hypothetical protein [Verrucomicrobiales bacterium]
MKNLLLLLAALSVSVASGAGRSDADIERDAEARIYTRFYEYVIERTGDVGANVKNINVWMSALDAVAADPKASVSGGKGWAGMGGDEPVRVPDWFAPEDLKLFRDGLAKIPADKAALTGARDALWPLQLGNLDAKQYAGLRAPIAADLQRVEKNVAALQSRALALAEAGETRLADIDPPGKFLLATRGDLQSVVSLSGFLSGDRPDAAKAAGLLEKLKTSAARHAADAERSPEKIRDAITRFQRAITRYTDYLEKNILPELRDNGAVSDLSILDSLTGSVTRCYDDFVAVYNSEGGHAFKRGADN